MAHEEFVRDDYDSCLGRLIEEAGEVVAALGKTHRFGPSSVNPLLPPEKQERNVDWVLRELKDLDDAARRFRRCVDRMGLVGGKL